ncbi:probable protein phosphatase 2C 42 isoform X3 [Sorghum bicolor]|uniref:probable protein phosphatase 2C 42 isoform X3 n=1 Tax=Sorghum bicolor TaxID=4558 RepID=UPI000B42526F|nr:probable protein phosphatase 2C 42 isoform X3 [Sorghum bicolor]|eukprot:XP_021318794.1 probable protein phosphatase 2C 42 isoform X3 [Sorghum bicolor]
MQLSCWRRRERWSGAPRARTSRSTRRVPMPSHQLWRSCARCPRCVSFLLASVHHVLNRGTTPGYQASLCMALAVPVTLKTTEEGGNERFDYAVSAMQGYRPNMEDAHAIVLNLDAATGTSFFGVYDGQGGPAVSKYCARHLHTELLRHESFRDNLQTAIERTFLRMDEMMKDRSAGWELSGYGGNDNWKAYRKALRWSLLLPFFCQKPAYPGPENDGCTVCVVLIRGNQIIVGNAGDSRCVLSRNNVAVNLSTDFKPSLPATGHAVTFSERKCHRVDDGIAIAISLGDLLYKDNKDLCPQQQAITAFPEELTQDDQFLIIACNGIWDCQTRHQAVDFIRTQSNTQVAYGMLKHGAQIAKFADKIRYKLSVEDQR